MAERNVWFGVNTKLFSLSLVNGDTLCFLIHALIARYSYVKPSAATCGSSMISCIMHNMMHEVNQTKRKSEICFHVSFFCVNQTTLPEVLDKRSGLVH